MPQSAEKRLFTLNPAVSNRRKLPPPGLITDLHLINYAETEVACAKAARRFCPMDEPNPEILETFENKNPERDYEIEISCPEFTCVCPKTGQPDFATITIKYVPDRLCVELKSLKLYMFSYRNTGEFHEHVTNRILNDFVSVCDPRSAEVTGDFNVRGGIKTIVRATHRKDT